MWSPLPLLLACMLCSCDMVSDKLQSARTSKSDATPAAPVTDSAAVVSASESAAAVAAVTQPLKKAKAKGGVDVPVLRCGLKPATRLTDTGIGDLQIGRTVVEVKQKCLVIRDAVQPGYEGNPEQILTVVMGPDLIRAAIANGQVSRISVTQPRFATADGLRVGTPLSRILGTKGVDMAEGEDGLYLYLPEHCGLNFLFSIQSRAKPGRPWPVPRLSQQHGGARVGRILVTRCVR